MHRGHAILAVLVLGAAAWAYFVAHPLGGGAPAGRGTVTVWQVPASEVSAVTFRDGPSRVTLRPRPAKGVHAATVWVQTGPSGAPAAASPSPTASGKAPPKPLPAEEFRGNAAARQALDSLTTLTAVRDLGRLAALDGKAFGFPGPGGFIELQRHGGTPLKLELGRETYGSTGRYAHDPTDGHVYLLPLLTLQRLAVATSVLMDRDLLSLQPEQAERVELRTVAGSRTLYHLSGAGRWGSSAQAAAADPDAGALVTDLQRLRVQRYRLQGEAPPAGPPALEVRLFASSGGEERTPTAWLRFYAIEHNTAPAVSSYTERPVDLPAAVVRDVLKKAHRLLHGT